jgi:hypothetical protein
LFSTVLDALVQLLTEPEAILATTPEEDSFLSIFFKEPFQRDLVEWKLTKEPALLEKELGFGGMGIVKEGFGFWYKLTICSGTFQGIPVAIKELRVDKSELNTARFEREAKLSTSLGIHPNVVTTFGIWTMGSCQIVMGELFCNFLTL